jgi:hypothetical protein
MITCPTCQHTEVEGALFCSECGAQLVSLQNLATQNFNITGQTSDFGDVPPVHQKDYSASDTISLQVLDGGQFIQLGDRSEFTVGRVSDGQSVMPDIDLTPYNAYENGVSRLHAVIKKGATFVNLMDLGSSNGTYLNGTRLTPERDYPLQHGGIISFGKLKIQFLVKHKA